MNSKQAQERSESQILLFRRVSCGRSAASLGREQGCVGGGYATGMHTTRQDLKGSTNPPPVTTAVGFVDLRHFPNGSRPCGSQPDTCRDVVFMVRSEVLPIILVKHGENVSCHGLVESPNGHPNRQLRQGCYEQLSRLCPPAKRRCYCSSLDNTPNSRRELGLGRHLIRAS